MGSALASLKTATPKLARFLSVQPLNRSFCCRPQKPCKALCGRRCRPLCPARGEQGNPSLSPAYFRTACRFPQKSAKTVSNRSLPLQGLCLPVVRLHLATRGDTGAYGRGFGGNINVAHLHSPRLLRYALFSWASAFSASARQRGKQCRSAYL